MMGERQLNLFVRRGKRPPPPLEFPVHCLIADLLRQACAPGWIWFHVPNGGERPSFVNSKGKRISIEGAQMKRMGVRPGVSDFLLIAPPRGQLHALELKRRGRKPTQEQIEFMAALQLAGGRAEWCDTFEWAVDILQRWGAIQGVRLS